MHLVPLFAAVALLSGCAFLATDPGAVEAARLLGVPQGAVLRLDDAYVAARVAGQGVEVLALPDSVGKVRSLTLGNAPIDANSAHLLSYGGDTGSEWNTFFYGTAAEGVSRIELGRPGAIGGAVVDGAWLIALPDRDLMPQDISWRFLDADGAVVLEGSGIFPPQA